MLLSATGGHAAPSASAADIQKQIDQTWNSLEPVIEQYNGVHTRLLQDQAKAAQLQAQIQPLQLQADLASARVGALSAQLYRMGPASDLSALLRAGTPDQLADQLTMLDEIAATHQSMISGSKGLLDQYAGQKAPLDALIAQEAKADADLAAKKSQIQAQLSQLERLRQQAVSAGAPVASGGPAPANCPVQAGSGAGGTAAAYACRQIGKPYVWAASGPNSFDCSGLTMAAWKAAGYTLAHFTGDQWKQTTRVSASDLRVGDLVFYFSDLHHVAIYVGGGWVVHAPHPGDHVRLAQMTSTGSVHGYGRVH